MINFDVRLNNVQFESEEVEQQQAQAQPHHRGQLESLQSCQPLRTLLGSSNLNQIFLRNSKSCISAAKERSLQAISLRRTRSSLEAIRKV